ncbi:tetratricopeptide repeat protein [Roseivirga sp. E12]|uniref:tetratricopeptide repeat protein n=1 Tax=Roseivirga sp. E12 TaxID=2819237 RepID=UPI001ABD2F7B|nr:tetratricopeptide repeat protein [Roseivirga sp. E12]MBO3698030.1 tetratricopeptide repeat protein [Roseivirga sp. E12]
MDTASGLPLLQKARQFQLSGDFINAEIYFKEALSDAPESKEVLTDIFQFYLASGNIQSAIAHLKKLIEIEKNSFERLMQLGQLLSQVQDFQGARNAIEKAHKEVPDNEVAILQLSQLHIHLGALGDAEVLLTSAIKSSAASPNAFLLLAQALFMQEKLSQAKAVLLELVEKQPTLPEPFINLGSIFEVEGNLEEAGKNFHMAISLDPAQFRTNFEYGRFLLAQLRYAEALPLLEKANQLIPQDNITLNLLGTIYQELGQFDEAIETFRSVLEQNPDSLAAHQNLAKVMTRFVPPWHLKMLADQERNDAFEKAIKKSVNKDSVVLDIGTGSGLLSMMAARDGAKKIYACEMSKYIADVAKLNIEKNGFSNRIEVFDRKSTQLIKSDLQETPNVIIAEIFDSGLLGEGAMPSFRHALEKLASDDCIVIPKAAEIKGRLLHSETLAAFNPITTISGFDVSAFDQFRVPGEYITQNLSEVNHEFCSSEFKILDVDFKKTWHALPEGQCRKLPLTVQVDSSKPIHGIAFWYTLFLDDHIELSNNPDRVDNHWGQAVAFFEQSIQGETGQSLDFMVCYTDTEIWFESPAFGKTAH